VLINEKLQTSLDQREVAISSRLNVDLLADSLHRALTNNCRGHVLDLGCGQAPLYQVYRPLCDSIVCADWQNSFHALKYIDINCDLTKPLPFADQSFDTVILSDVLEHIPTPSALLGECFRVLGANGALIGSVPFLYWLHEEPYDYHRYTEHGLRSMATRVGFEVEMIEAYGGGTDVIFDLLGKIAIPHHWRIGPRLADYSYRIGKLVRRGKIGLRLSTFVRSMPLGYSFVLRKRC
jgi:SAM-dependent methyltransferase